MDHSGALTTSGDLLIRSDPSEAALAVRSIHESTQLDATGFTSEPLGLNVGKVKKRFFEITREPGVDPVRPDTRLVESDAMYSRGER